MSEVCPVCQASVSENDAVCSQCGFKLLGATQKIPAVESDDHVPSKRTRRLSMPFCASFADLRRESSTS